MIAILGLIIGILGFMVTIFMSRFLGMAMIMLGTVMFFGGLQSSVNKVNKNAVKNMLAKDSVIGKDVKYIEQHLGKYTNVNISNDKRRVYTWDDYFEIICDENNVCIEILKQ